MADIHNVFISHYSEDDAELHRLKERLEEKGCKVRNSSVEKGDYRKDKVADATIAKELRGFIKWAGTFVVLIGEHTHERPWVNYEIRSAYLQGKRIIGVYMHGCKNDVELPEAFKRYCGPAIGWNSRDKLIDVIEGECLPPEAPEGGPAQPIYNIIHIKC